MLNSLNPCIRQLIVITYKPVGLNMKFAIILSAELRFVVYNYSNSPLKSRKRQEIVREKSSQQNCRLCASHLEYWC